MYITIGGDVILLCKDVIGIFDLDKTTVFKVNRNYLSNTEKRGKMVNTTEKLPKSFIVCEDKGKETVYLSQLLPSTLFKRENV